MDDRRRLCVLSVLYASFKTHLSCIHPWLFSTAQSRFLVSGSADNEMRLWSVQTGKCLYVWEFPTAVKRVAFNEDDDQIVCITEQRMGYQSTVRVFDINREGDGTNRTYALFLHAYLS